MRKEPIVKSLKTGNEFPFDTYKFGHLSKDEYPITLIYEEEKVIEYDIKDFKLERFWFKGSKTINKGYLFKEI